MVHWDDFRFILALHRYGTMTAAAASLRTNVATVSRRIERAGEQLGSPLFQKEGGSWAVTTAGRAFITVAEEFEANLLREENNLGAECEDQVTTINIAAPPVIVSTVLLPALQELVREQPKVDVILTNRTSGRGLGDADVLLRWGAPASSRLIARRIGTMSFGAYRKSTSTSKDWAALTAEHDGSPISQLGFTLFGRPPRLRAGIFDHKVMAMRETGLAGIVPDAIRKREPWLEPLPEHAATRTNMDIWCAYHGSRRGDATLQRVISWVIKAVTSTSNQGTESDQNSSVHLPGGRQF